MSDESYYLLKLFKNNKYTIIVIYLYSSSTSSPQVFSQSVASM
jgi:hypothetical protein